MNKLKIHFLNTIWSDGIILEKTNKFAMVDTCTSFYYPMVKEYLESLKVKDIEFIFLTHFHCDHYGNVASIIKDFNVSTLYIKHYHGLDGTTSSGYASNEEYIKNEFKNYYEIIDTANLNNTKIVYIDDIKNDELLIDFFGTTLDIYDYHNRLYELYTDKEGEFYNQKRFNENFNCAGIFIQEGGNNIFLGADVTCSTTDIEEVRALSYKMIEKVYKKYNISSIDLYKSCHHGGGGTNTPLLCDLLKAKYVVITNTDKWLDTWNTYDNLKNANKDVVILPTDLQKYVFTISDTITYETIKEQSLFITLNKK